MKTIKPVKLNLNKQVICRLAMEKTFGGAPDTLTWGCSEDKYTCKSGGCDDGDGRLEAGDRP